MGRSSALNGDPFDLAYLFNSFYTFPDQAGALSHIRKACCEGARLVIFDYTRPSGRKLPTELGLQIGRPIVFDDLLRLVAGVEGKPTDENLDPIMRRHASPHNPLSY